MNFIEALKECNRGFRIRRKAWSYDPASADFHFDLVVRDDSYVMANNKNHYYYPSLTVFDYWAGDWFVVDEGANERLI